MSRSTLNSLRSRRHAARWRLGRVALVCLVAALAALSACGPSDSGSTTPSPSPSTTQSQAGEVGTITYRYGDSSVPPKYHRSYTLTVTPKSASIVVDSYGEVLATDETAITESEWDAILTAYRAVPATASQSPAGCAGGTSRGWVVTNTAGVQLNSLQVYVCSDSPEIEAVADQMAAVFTPLLDAHFDMEKLLD